MVRNYWIECEFYKFQLAAPNYEVDDASETVFILRVKRKRGPETYEGLDRLN